MIYLITGVPGAGKTLLTVSWLEQWVREGRAVYANVDGLQMEGVEEAPEDWRDAPEGSVWAYDEIQRLWPSSGRAGQAEREDIRALETHRHTGHDIVIATQHPTLVHHHVRKLVGQHVHIERHGNKTVTIMRKDQAFDIADKQDRMNADKQLWRYPKRLFGYYKSATAHTHKFRVPRKLLFLAGFLAVLVGGAGYGFTQWDMGSATERATGVSASDGSPRSNPGQNVRPAVNRSSSRPAGDYRLVGGKPQSLDGAPLSQVWRIAGRLKGGGRQIFLLKSINGDRQRVPGQGWEVVGYKDGLLRARAPGGVIRVSWLTNVESRERGGVAPMNEPRRTAPTVGTLN